MTPARTRAPRAPRLLVALLCLAALPAVARADEALGRKLTRAAQRALEAGELEEAVDLAERARVEWPGAPAVAHTLGDVRFHQGDYDGALREYAKGASGGGAFRAFFNQGVTLSARGEQGLTEAGVPLDPAGLLPEAPPGPLIQAIDAAVPDLEDARGRFLDALVEESDAGARESIAALNERLDDLAEMKEELEKRQQEQEEQQQDQDSEDQQDQEQDQDQQQQDEQDDQEQQQDGEGEQDEQQDQQPQDQEQDPNEQDPQDQPQEPTPDQDQQQPQAQPQAKPLTPEEMQALLEQLEEMEERARLMQRIRQARDRKPVEKDW